MSGKDLADAMERAAAAIGQQEEEIQRLRAELEQLQQFACPECAKHQGYARIGCICCQFEARAEKAEKELEQVKSHANRVIADRDLDVAKEWERATKAEKDLEKIANDCDNNCVSVESWRKEKALREKAEKELEWERHKVKSLRARDGETHRAFHDAVKHKKGVDGMHDVEDQHGADFIRIIAAQRDKAEVKAAGLEKELERLTNERLTDSHLKALGQERLKAAGLEAALREMIDEDASAYCGSPGDASDGAEEQRWVHTQIAKKALSGQSDLGDFLGMVKKVLRVYARRYDEKGHCWNWNQYVKDSFSGQLNDFDYEGDEQGEPWQLAEEALSHPLLRAWEQSKEQKVYDRPCFCREQVGQEPGHIHASKPAEEGK